MSHRPRQPAPRSGNGASPRPVPLRLLPSPTPIAPRGSARPALRLLAPPAVDRAAGAQALLLAAGGLLALGIIARRWGAPGGPVAPAATEVALRAALRHRDNAIAQVAHDLKTPLTVLKGHAQLLQRALVATDGADAARLRAGLAAIDAAATAAADRIDRLAGETGPPGET